MSGRLSRDRSGSVLMVTVVIAGLMALAVGSFIKLANSQNRLSSVSFYGNNSLNLAEGGVEKALFALNYDDWEGWTRDDSLATMDTLTLDLGNNQTGVVQVRIEDYDTQPVVIAEGRTVLSNRPDITKQIEVRLSRRSLFANGITSRRGTTFKGGNVFVDSYKSSMGNPSAFNSNDRGSVASVSVETDAIDLSNSIIYGYVATGGSMPTVGPKGRIYGSDTPDGVKVDVNRITLDFDSDFPEIAPPTGADYYIPTIDSTRFLGTSGASSPTVYRVDEISLSGSNSLVILGPVVLHVTGDVRVSGNAYIYVAGTGRMELYGENDVDIGGNGAVNSTYFPKNLLVYGTNPIHQTVKITGNGNLRAAVYAPNADVEIKGNGSVAGAIVGDRVVMNGNANFHYDEDLGNFAVDNSYRMDFWREIHLAADRFAF